jgi:hypothetical protein
MVRNLRRRSARQGKEVRGDGEGEGEEGRVRKKENEVMQRVRVEGRKKEERPPPAFSTTTLTKMSVANKGKKGQHLFQWRRFLVDFGSALRGEMGQANQKRAGGNDHMALFLLHRGLYIMGSNDKGASKGTIYPPTASSHSC